MTCNGTPFEKPPHYSPERVQFIRTQVAKMSPSAFASFMRVSVSTVRRWESAPVGQRASGAAARLLQLLESKGVETLTIGGVPGNAD